MKYEFGKLQLNVKKMEQKLVEYKQFTKFETFSGFLLFVGLTPFFMREMGVCIENGNDKYVKVGKFLENYKMELEVKMEEYLLYQGQHDDLKELKNYNYQYLQFLLKSSNPSKYGEKNIISVSKDRQETKIKILENKGSIKLCDK